MKNSPQAPLNMMKLHTEVQWSDAARKINFGSLKYVTMEALMRQGVRAVFFNAPSLHELPTPDDKSTFVIDVNIVDDEEIREINNQYRGKDKPTDVLSFAQLEGESTFAAGEQILLGDIIISLPTALKQAEAEGHPLPEEMAFLAVHAMLHLLGYDHENAADKKQMWEQQNAIMARICNWPPNRNDDPIVILCVLIEAVFTAMEVSFGAVPKARLRSIAENSEDQKPSLVIRAASAVRLSERNDQLTLLFLTVTCLTMWSTASLLLWWLLDKQYSPWWIFAAMLPVLFVAEVLPLAIAARFAESIVLHSAKFLRIALFICCPLLWVIRTIAHGIAVLHGSSKISSMHLTEGEVRSAIATAEEEGVLDQSERDMLEMAIDFRSKLVREVMTPRPDIRAVSDAYSLEETLKCSFESGHSRLPVYQGSLDKIVGIVAIKDMVPLARSGNGELVEQRVGDMVRAAYFVPEDKHISTTFEEMRRRHTLMAIVVDDEGTTTGLITVEDLLEELVGEIQDEYDNEEPPLQRHETNGVSCDASVSVRDLERFWEREFNQSAQLYTRDGEEADDSISLAALALDLFDGVPQIGAQCAAGTPDLTLTVLGMDGPRIVKVLLKTTSFEESRA